MVLFIRPTVWAGLTYLHGAVQANLSPSIEVGFGIEATYAATYASLLLLLPRRRERAESAGGILAHSRTRETRTRGEGTVGRAREPWSVVRAKLSPNHLPHLMRAGTAHSGLLVGVLIATWQFAPVRVPYTPPPTLSAGSGEGPVDLGGPPFP